MSVAKFDDSAVTRLPAMGQLKFYCIFCGIGIDAALADAGGVSRCPGCSRETPVPAAPSSTTPAWAKTYPPDVFTVEVRFPCPECGARLVMDGRNAGDPGLCPRCAREIRCPQLSFMAEFATPPPAPAEEAARGPVRLTSEEIEFLRAPGYAGERSVDRAA
jgi:predicted RNA-binding Zn-ribbon protein involved in translation (DUF1610 family)